MEWQANIKFCCRLWKTDGTQDSDKLWVGWSRVQTPVGGHEIFHTHPNQLKGQPSLLYTDYWSFFSEEGSKVAVEWS